MRARDPTVFRFVGFVPCHFIAMWYMTVYLNRGIGIVSSNLPAVVAMEVHDAISSRAAAAAHVRKRCPDGSRVIVVLFVYVDRTLPLRIGQ